MNSIQKNTPQARGAQGIAINQSIPYPKVVNPLGLVAPEIPGQEPFELRRPVRKIRASWVSIAGMVPFGYLGVGVWHESLLEGELLEIVKTWEHPRIGILEQPMTLSLAKLGLGKGKYTPDFLCWVMEGDKHPTQVTLIEVKPGAKLSGESLKRLRNKIKAGMRFARLQGWSFRLISERHLRRPPRISGPGLQIHRENYSPASAGEVLARVFGPRRVE